MAHLTTRERELYTHLFLKYDTNGDGWLNLGELSVLCNVLGYKLTQSKIKSLFNSLDTDQNSRVTLDEFLVIMPQLPPTERKCANLRRLFNEADRDKDGRLSADELSRIVRSGDTLLSEDEAKRLIAQVDKNGDNKLDFEEFPPTGHPYELERALHTAIQNHHRQRYPFLRFHDAIVQRIY